MTDKREKFYEIVNSRPLTRHKKMFGGIGGWVKDTIFIICDSGGEIYLRFNDADREELSSTEGTGPFMNMREYLRVPEHVLSDEIDLDDWVERSFQYALTIPPKKKSPRKKQ